ncbi:MAG: ABC transporter ATP-binding protein [Actinobacteria bacterium]|nr:ABC transporter ATP-binding protein [Actinomycetota bacterium]
MSEAIVQIKNLYKSYGKIKAVDDISFNVFKGEIFGLVGPNGAGKTTTIECIEGLRKPSSGSIDVLGFNPTKDGRNLRKYIGIQLQQSELPERLKVWEALELFNSFYHKTIKWPSLLDDLGLKEKQKSYFDKLSGGQKQRLFIALALINDPDVLFLDELTTGLDPQARRNTWKLIENIRKKGKTIFLTTHYMEEAERLCNRVAIMNHGKIIALDTPENLIRDIDVEQRLIFNLVQDFDINLIKQLSTITNAEQKANKIVVYGKDQSMVSDVINLLVKNNIRFLNLKTEQATLEDVFLTLTGSEMEKEE